MSEVINQATLFNNVPDEQIYMNNYDLSFDNILTTEIGRNTVLFCRRVLPGEYWKMNLDMFVRTMPLLAPVYGKMDLYAHAFYCTNRSLSDVWENYIRSGEDGETVYKPDLLSVKNKSNNYDLREPLDSEDIFTISKILSGEPSNFDAYYKQHPEYRAPFTHGSLFDYLNVNSSFEHADVMRLADTDLYPGDIMIMPFEYSLLPFKAYQAIWSEYYADANIMTFDDMDTIDFRWMLPVNEVDISPNDYSVRSLTREGLRYPQEYGDSTIIKNLFKTRYRCYAKDYFTSSLPEPQRGPDVTIPISADIDIYNNYSSDGWTEIGATGATDGVFGLSDNLDAEHRKFKFGVAHQQDVTQHDVDFTPLSLARVYNANQLRAELSNLTATITDLRTAVALQEFYESSARYGNRYKEFIYGHFGSTIPDDQLTRPWYLGGLKIPIQISDVMQTSTDNGSNLGVGNMYGKGLSATDEDNLLFERKFDDYGLIMVIMSIRPHNYYKNTVMKEWRITDKLDEYWRKLQGVGEEQVYNWELSGFSSENRNALERADDTFGYQMRYSNYKFSNDEVHGDFKGTLSYWTMCRDFSTGVALSPEFLEIKPQEFNHIFQYEALDYDHFLINSHFSVIRQAPMDIYSIPRIN